MVSFIFTAFIQSHVIYLFKYIVVHSYVNFHGLMMSIFPYLVIIYKREWYYILERISGVESRSCMRHGMPI